MKFKEAEIRVDSKAPLSQRPLLQMPTAFSGQQSSVFLGNWKWVKQSYKLWGVESTALYICSKIDTNCLPAPSLQGKFIPIMHVLSTHLMHQVFIRKGRVLPGFGRSSESTGSFTPLNFVLPWFLWLLRPLLAQSLLNISFGRLSLPST